MLFRVVAVERLIVGCVVFVDLKGYGWLFGDL